MGGTGRRAGYGGVARPAEVWGRPPRGGCRGGGRTAGGARTRSVLRLRWCGGLRWCGSAWSGPGGPDGASRLAAVSLDVARPRGSAGQIAACSSWSGCAPRGPDRADRPRSRCRRAGPAPHARPGRATAGAGRRRQPGRPTRRQVVQRASAAGRPCAVWHNLPPRPPTRWSTAARASMSLRPFLVRLATVTTSLARNASTAGCSSASVTPGSSTRQTEVSIRSASEPVPSPASTHSRTATSVGQRGVQRGPHGLGVAADRQRRSRGTPPRSPHRSARRRGRRSWGAG